MPDHDTTPVPITAQAPLPVVVAPANPHSVWSLAARWLLGQEASTVFQFATTGAILYGIWIGVPMLVNHIQAGYERINAANLVDRKDDRDLLREILFEQRKQGREARERDRRDQDLKASEGEE